MPAYNDPIFFLSGFDAARIAALIRALDFARRNRESGGVYNSMLPLLDELEEFGGRWTASVIGSAEVPQTPDLVEVPEQEMTTKEAAKVLDISDRGVRLACEAGRLEGRKVGGEWRVAVESIAAYHEQRQARKGA
jgi:excisionase family DNA binding protein